MFGGLTHDPAIELANYCCHWCRHPCKRYFMLKGDMGVEVAMKMAVQYWVCQKSVELLEGASTKKSNFVNHGNIMEIPERNVVRMRSG